MVSDKYSDINTKLREFENLHGTMRRSVLDKTQKGPQHKFYRPNVTAISFLLYGSE